MENPSWDDAPDWAFFLILDKIGRWLWCEYPPKVSDKNISGFEYRGGKIQYARMPNPIGPMVFTRS